MTLHASQVLFIASILGFLAYIFWLRTAGTDRLLYALLVVVGIFLVLFPELATRLAHLIGIGRGADLVFYLFVIGSLFLSAHLLARLHDAERKITLLVRRLAVDQALREAAPAAPSASPMSPTLPMPLTSPENPPA
jgi:hypothetical protein